MKKKLEKKYRNKDGLHHCMVSISWCVSPLHPKSCDLISVCTCRVQTDYPLIEPSESAPAHLSLASSPVHAAASTPRQRHLCPLSRNWSQGGGGGVLIQKRGSTLGRWWGGITGISGALLLDKVQTKRAFSGRDTDRASPHTPGWPGES